MRSNIISCAIALSLALGLAGTASAQRHGPPSGEVSLTQALDQRLQLVVAKLSRRSDAAATQMAARANALLEKLRSTPDMSDEDLNTIRAQVEQMEDAVG